MSFRSDIETLVLATLAHGPQHGYEITKHVNGLEKVRLQDGQLYPILHQLEADGFIEAEWIPQEGKPSRKVYRLTAQGSGRLEEKRADWEAFAKSITTLLDAPKPVTPHPIKTLLAF
jgi:PadR family transcriptional regulator, regulatory protein PadR